MLAGEGGFEPPRSRFRAGRLTAWLLPENRVLTGFVGVKFSAPLLRS